VVCAFLGLAASTWHIVESGHSCKAPIR
jgi:hypothetical protein